MIVTKSNQRLIIFVAISCFVWEVFYELKINKENLLSTYSISQLGLDQDSYI